MSVASRAVGREPRQCTTVQGHNCGPVANATDVPRVIDPPVNLGFSAKLQLGRPRARGEHIVLLQNDGMITPGWLEA